MPLQGADDIGIRFEVHIQLLRSIIANDDALMTTKVQTAYLLTGSALNGTRLCNTIMIFAGLRT